MPPSGTRHLHMTRYLRSRYVVTDRPPEACTAGDASLYFDNQVTQSQLTQSVCDLLASEEAGPSWNSVWYRNTRAQIHCLPPILSLLLLCSLDLSALSKIHNLQCYLSLLLSLEADAILSSVTMSSLPDNVAVYAAVPALIWSSVVYVVQSVGIFKL